MRHDESMIQAQIVQYLSLKRIFFFSVPNELMGGGRNAPRRMAQFKSMGLRAGISDLVIIGKSGRAHFLEVKTPLGRLSPEQARFKSLCDSSGWPYAIARSVEQAIVITSTWMLTSI